MTHPVPCITSACTCLSSAMAGSAPSGTCAHTQGEQAAPDVHPSTHPYKHVLGTGACTLLINQHRQRKNSCGGESVGKQRRPWHSHSVYKPQQLFPDCSYMRALARKIHPSLPSTTVLASSLCHSKQAAARFQPWATKPSVLSFIVSKVLTNA